MKQKENYEKPTGTKLEAGKIGKKRKRCKKRKEKEGEEN